MKQFMVIALTDLHEHLATFRDDYVSAKKDMVAAETLGWKAEIYERCIDNDGVEQYMFICN